MGGECALERLQIGRIHRRFQGGIDFDHLLERLQLAESLHSVLLRPKVEMRRRRTWRGGLRADLIERAKARGKLTFSLVGSVRHARKALDMGVEVLVAQGYDAGGHTGTVGTLSLLPQVIAEAGEVPVLAAGGIATGAQVLGVLATDTSAGLPC